MKKHSRFQPCHNLVPNTFPKAKKWFPLFFNHHLQDIYSLRVEISFILSFLRMQESPFEQVVRRCLYSQA